MLNKIFEKDVANCFVCKQEMFSDIEAKNHCRLCGMIIDDSELFCCDGCENKFVRVMTKDFK